MRNVKEHRELLSKQVFLRCYWRVYSNQELIELEPYQRHVGANWICMKRSYATSLCLEKLFFFKFHDAIWDDERNMVRKTLIILALLRTGWCSRMRYRFSHSPQPVYWMTTFQIIGDYIPNFLNSPLNPQVFQRDNRAIQRTPYMGEYWLQYDPRRSNYLPSLNNIQGKKTTNI